MWEERKCTATSKSKVALLSQDQEFDQFNSEVEEKPLQRADGLVVLIL